MKPIAIIRFSPSDGPGYFATFLDQTRVAWRMFCLDEGEAVPADPGQFSGLCLLGGPMSANDDLPWTAAVLSLIDAAVSGDIAMIGHCLGGQLMARAMGGEVTVNAVKEIGWHPIERTDSAIARHWFGEPAVLPVFQWHGDTFSIPPAAMRLAGSPHCRNQAFARGKHLALQCHIEMTREGVEQWCADGKREIDASRATATGAGVQSVDEILCDLETRVAGLNALAAGIYRRWLGGVAFGSAETETP